jgi:predicted lipoprotein with Yx(FWY)xxD motif
LTSAYGKPGRFHAGRKRGGRHPSGFVELDALGVFADLWADVTLDGQARLIQSQPQYWGVVCSRHRIYGSARWRGGPGETGLGAVDVLGEVRLTIQGSVMPNTRGSTHWRFGGRRVPKSKAIALCVALIAIASMTAIAVAAGATLGTGTAQVSGKSKKVVVDSRGVTLYTLSGERVGRVTRLKCVNSRCFRVWPPLKTTASAKLTKASGVDGTLGKLRRVKGKFYQVTLDAHPLYTFAPDQGKKGSAKGEGVKAFGGTWHVVAAR